MSKAFEALLPSVGSKVGELGTERAHLDLCERAAGEQSAQEPADAVALCGRIYRRGLQFPSFRRYTYFGWPHGLVV